jgi:hypothetical protein
MRSATVLVLLVGAGVGIFLAPQRLAAQACQDEEAMVTDYKKEMADLLATVRKESLPDFEKAFHQKASLTKLSLYESLTDSLVKCLDKAIADPTTPKEQMDGLKAERDSDAKLKNTIQHDHDALKAAEAPKDAKALIAKFDLDH